MGSVVFQHPLPRSLPIVEREAFILEVCRGKRVVHLGCVDEGLIEDKLDSGVLLHSKIAKVASWLAGVDRDAEGIRKLNAARVGDLNTCLDVTEEPLAIDHPVDLVVAAEIIEHLANPGKFLSLLEPFLRRTGAELMITTPNAFGASYTWNMVRGRELVHQDHNCYYSITTLGTLLAKHGYEVSEWHLYSNPSTTFREWLGARIGGKSGGHVASPSAAAAAPAPPANGANARPSVLDRAGWVLGLAAHDLALAINPAFAEGLIATAKTAT